MSAPPPCTIAIGSFNRLNPILTMILSAGNLLLITVQVWPPSADLAATPVAPAQMVLLLLSTASPTMPSAPGVTGPNGWLARRFQTGWATPHGADLPLPPPPPPLPPPPGSPPPPPPPQPRKIERRSIAPIPGMRCGRRKAPVR